MRNDDKHTHLLTLTGESSGQTDDLEKQWLESAVGAAGHNNDLWLAYFQANGATSGDFNTAAYEHLIAVGVPAGALPDMWAYGWENGLIGGGGATLAFHALTYDDTTYEMLGVKTGTGDLTTTHTADLYAPDNEGVYREFAANEPVWSEGRVVLQMCRSTDDLTITPWVAVDCTVTSGVSDPDGGNTAFTLTSTAASGWVRQDNGVANADTRNFINSIWIRRRTGTGIIALFGPNRLSIDITSQVTSEWQRFSVATLGAASTSPRIAVRCVTSGDQVDIWHPLVEESTGRSDTTTPSEYIENTQTVGNSFLTKVYANNNGNTVLNNVVTEAVGTPLSEVPYLQYYPAATNSCLYSRDLTNAQWSSIGTGSATYDQVGLDGSPNSASLLSDASAAEFAGVKSVYTKINGRYAFKWYVEKDTNTSRYPGVEIRFDNNTSQRVGVIFSTANTGYTVFASDPSIYSVDVFDDGKNIVLCLSADDEYTAATVDIYLYSALSSDGSTLSSSVQGSVNSRNAELYWGKTTTEVRSLGPIFTTSASVSTDAAKYIFASGTVGPDTAAWYYEGIFDGGSEASGNCMCPNSANARGLGHDLRSGVGRVDLGCNAIEDTSSSTVLYSSLGSLSRRTEFKHGTSMEHGGNGDVCIDGVWTGSPITPTYGLFQNHLSDAFAINRHLVPNAMKLRNLRRYDTSDFEDGKDTIDALMGA